MKLSIVLAGRNDDYGGNYLKRMNRCIETLPKDVEIVFVEWNPTATTKPLSSEIGRHGVRVITVPWDIHKSLEGWDLFPMYEYRAKNAGIQRSTGDWVLVMNSDIELSESMRSKLAEEFDPSCIYRAHRHDFRDKELVQVCDGPGDFVLMSRNCWMELTGYPDLVSYTHIDSLLLWNARQAGLTEVFLDSPIFHDEHDRSEHKNRWGIHSSDMPRFIGQRNEPGWGLKGIVLPEKTT